eukprot:Tbor_TRINITY_DN4886_c0_g1::TRINITY_DN4886_c0_g1_i1::g.1266::m.1266/K11092/SNRPA1; U2 small nuclear ribonucleoprotein A'
MRLSIEHLTKASHVVNPTQEREINLRGMGIQLLDGRALEALNDDFDCINLSDNQLLVLDGFPVMNRLTTLIVHRNYGLTKLPMMLPFRIPHLNTLVANDTGFSTYASLSPLQFCKELLRVSFMGCPLVTNSRASADVQSTTTNAVGGRTTSMLHNLSYDKAVNDILKGNPILENCDEVKLLRLFLITICPTLKLINFDRVLDSERAEAKAHNGVLRKLLTVGTGDKEGKEPQLDSSTTTVGNKIRKRDTKATVLTLPGDAGISKGEKKTAEMAETATGASGVPTEGDIRGTSGLLMTKEQIEAEKLELEQRMEAAETMEDINDIEARIEELQYLEAELIKRRGNNKRHRAE